MSIDIVHRLRAPRGGIVADTQTLSAARDAADEIERLRAGLEEIDMRGKQYAAEELADMARAVLDGKNPEAAFNNHNSERDQ
tara:strand:- start:500 stop:745 length:246 start_codon:yes stop_codon:yes gene_type:complete